MITRNPQLDNDGTIYSLHEDLTAEPIFSNDIITDQKGFFVFSESN